MRSGLCLSVFVMLLGGEISAGNVLQAEQPENALRVMSFNIRYGTARDGENDWEHRKEFVVETVRDYAPDLLGTQETLGFQRDDLSQGLPGYCSFGVGRDDGKEKGEMMAIFYRADRFEKLEGGHFWYSETPAVPGSKSWDSSLPRLASWVKLKDRLADNRVLYFFNTHFDHRGPLARLESAKLLQAQVKKLAGEAPAIITGDFNSAENSPPYQALFAGESGQPFLRDSYRTMHPEPVKDEKTAGGFRLADRSTARIDWIACTRDWTILTAAIEKIEKNGRTPSDHDPITAIFQWSQKE